MQKRVKLTAKQERLKRAIKPLVETILREEESMLSLFLIKFNTIYGSEGEVFIRASSKQDAVQRFKKYGFSFCDVDSVEQIYDEA